jgi:hypothetical protein
MCALPSVQIIDPAVEEYSEEREERVRPSRNDRVEFEQRVKVKHRRVG